MPSGAAMTSARSSSSGSLPGCSAIPAPYRDLFHAHQALLDSHRGYDPGALILARALATAFAAPLVASTVSRLLVDEPLRRAMASSGQSYVRASRGYQTLAKLVADKYTELLHAQ